MEDSWEDFEIPTLQLCSSKQSEVVSLDCEPSPLVLGNNITSSSSVTTSNINNNNNNNKNKKNNVMSEEEKIALEKAKQKYVEFVLRTYYKNYSQMNKIGKEKTTEKIMKEIAKCKSAGSIYAQLEIEQSLRSGRQLGGITA